MKVRGEQQEPQACKVIEALWVLQAHKAHKGRVDWSATGVHKDLPVVKVELGHAVLLVISAHKDHKAPLVELVELV